MSSFPAVINLSAVTGWPGGACGRAHKCVLDIFKTGRIRNSIYEVTSATINNDHDQWPPLLLLL